MMNAENDQPPHEVDMVLGSNLPLTMLDKVGVRVDAIGNGSGRIELKQPHVPQTAGVGYSDITPLAQKSASAVNLVNR